MPSWTWLKLPAPAAVPMISMMTTWATRSSVCGCSEK